MSTECVPLSISTPPPATAGSEFQRRETSSQVENVFSKWTTCPRMPAWISERALAMSFT